MDTASILWADVNGNQTITRVNSSAGVAAFKAAMLGCSTGDWSQQWESTLATNVPAPTGGTFSSVGDRAVLLFICADNTMARIIVPAPALAIFQSDGETVNPAALPVTALVAAALGQLVSTTGSPATNFVAGYRLPRAQAPQP